MPSKGGIQITNEDIDIFGHLFDCRFATIDYLVSLIGRSAKALYRRLGRLTEHRYIQVRRDSFRDVNIYAVHKQGVEELVRREIVPEQALDSVVRLQERSRDTLHHALQTIRLLVCLKLASRESPIKLFSWQHEGKSIYDKVNIFEGGESVRYPVRPDAFFLLEDTRQPEGEGIFPFFVETELQRLNKRFRDKIKAYEHYYDQELETKKFGIKGFSVITTTPTMQLATNRCEAARQVLSRDSQRFYYFAPLEYLSFDTPERIFDDIFLTPQSFKTIHEKGQKKVKDTGRRYTLIPPLDR